MTLAPSTPPVTPVPEARAERTVYEAGGGRRVAFSLIFLLLLPFFLSLPAMLFWRISKGLWYDTLGLIIMAAGFTAIMVLLGVELMRSLRQRIELKDDAVRMTVHRSRGPTPWLRYQTLEVPYKDIAAVETRREIYGGAMTPVLLRGSRLVKHDATTVPLGFVSEADMDPVFPYPEIAQKIADRAGVPLTDRGNVHKGFRRHRKPGAADRTAAALLDEAAIADLNKRHNTAILALVFALALLIGVGIVTDLMSAWNGAPQVAAKATR